MSPSTLEERLNDLDESPLGRVEFGANVLEEGGETTVHIRHFRVSREYRGRGVGRKTMEAALDIVRDSPVDVVEVSANLKNSGGVIDFLDSLGFEDLAVHQHGEDEIAAGVYSV